ncbi:MAG TPA: hypothetical protein VFR01_07695, partial [Geobacterales bacterium]|nr:hypothetical protein [Geobacterales bacterium]
HNIIDKSGAWFSFAGERIGQGRENARVYLKEHPQTMANIEEKLFAAAGIKRMLTPVEGNA